MEKLKFPFHFVSEYKRKSYFLPSPHLLKLKKSDFQYYLPKPQYRFFIDPFGEKLLLKFSSFEKRIKIFHSNNIQMIPKKQKNKRENIRYIFYNIVDFFIFSKCFNFPSIIVNDRILTDFSSILHQ